MGGTSRITMRFPKTILSILVFAVTSCGSNGDEPGEDRNSDKKAGNLSIAAVKSVFPGLRIDSIASFKEYGNIKITYDGDLLASYSERYNDGRVHDGVYFTLEWTRDTVYVRNYSKIYKAVIGADGYVSKLICPNGKTNIYEYDAELRLVKYDEELYVINDNQRWELSWDGGNMVRGLRISKSGSYSEYLHTYGSQDNKAGLLPPDDMLWWINDSGLSMGCDVNAALYFAGLLGRGTATLPTQTYYKHRDNPTGVSSKFSYKTNSDGYVTEAGYNKHSDGSDYTTKTFTIKYFYKGNK